MYATLEQARARGAVGTDAEVTAAIVAAMERVDRFTGDHFEPVTESVQVRVKGDYAPARRRLQSVTSITAPVPGQAPRTIPTTAYMLEPHGVRFRAWGSDVLVAGAEPWSGGWANLIGPLDGTYVTIAGVWGWDAPPDEVADATAILAALEAPATWAPQADAEGDPIGVPPATDEQYRDPVEERVAPAGRLERTTGDADADRLLAPFIVSLVRFG